MVGQAGVKGALCWSLCGTLWVLAVACGGGSNGSNQASAGQGGSAVDGGGSGVNGAGGAGGGALGSNGSAGESGGAGGSGGSQSTQGSATSSGGNGGGGGSTAIDTTGGGAGGGSGDAGSGGAGADGGSSIDFEFPQPGSAITRPFQGTLTIDTVQDMVSFCASYDGVRGSVHVYGPDIVNLNELSCLVEVTGPLELEAPNLELANLPNLVALGTLFSATPQKLVEFDMPKLRTVTNEVRITAPNLPAIELPGLQGVGEELVIASITPLLSIGLPELLWVGGEINVESSQLKDVNLAKLQHVGGDLRLPGSLEHLSLLEIVEAGRLLIPGGSYADIELSGLVSSTSVSLVGNELSTELVDLALPSLKSVERVHVSGFPNLTSIDLPVVAVPDNFTVVDNPRLEAVSAPGIVECSWLQLEFAGDPELPNFETGDYARFSLAEVGELTLPKLRQVETELNVFGAVVVSLPELAEVSTATFGRYLNAEATVGTELSLPSLTTARTLRIAEGVESLEMPVLQSFTQLTISSTWLSELSLNFVNAGIIDTRDNPDLTRIEFPSLVSAQRLSIGDTPLLDSVLLPVLREIAEDLSFTEIPMLSSVDLPELESVGNLSFRLTRSENSLSAPKLGTLGQLFLFYAGFTNLSLPSVTLLSEGLSITNNATLEVLSLPAASGTSATVLTVTDNQALETFEAPLIDWGGAVTLRNNPELPTFDLSGMTRATSIAVVDNALLANLAGFSALDRVGDVTIYDNPLLTDTAVNDFVASIATVTGDVVLAPP